jgi:hypothetical protein
VQDACQEILQSRGSRDRGSQRQGNRVAGNRDRRYPDSDVSRVGTTRVKVVDRCLSSGRVGKSMENPDTIRAVHLWDRWQPSRTHRKIGNRRIGDFVDTKPLHFETAKSETSKRREAIRTVHQRGRVVRDSGQFRVRDIGSSGVVKHSRNEIAICNFPTPP